MALRHTVLKYTKITAFVVCVSKKAIMECDEEWAMNKKVVDLSSRNVRQAVRHTLFHDPSCFPTPFSL